MPYLSTYRDRRQDILVLGFLRGWGFVGSCRRRSRELGQQRGLYRVPDRHRQGIRHTFSVNSQDMEGKLSHITNHCQEENVMKYRNSLAYRPGRPGRSNNLAIRSEHV